MPTTEIPDVLQSLGNQVNMSEAGLSDEEKAQCSKVLFPDTHTNKITVFGRERELRPTSVKVSRQLSALLEPFGKKVEDAQAKDLDIQVDEDILAALLGVAECLCKFYGSEWDDIYKSIKEEDISQIDLEAIAFTQQDLNGANDFLLRHLRVIIHMLKMREIATVKIGNMLSQSIMLPS